MIAKGVARKSEEYTVIHV